MKKYVRLLPLAGLMLLGCAQATQKEMAAAEASQPAPSTDLAAEIPLARLWRVAGHPVIYQGSMELEVADFAAASARLDTLLGRRGAYLTEAHETTGLDRHQQALTIRVPSASFLALTADLTRLGIVHSKDLTSRDIAAELAQAKAAASPASAADTAVAAAARATAQLLTEQATLATLHLTYFQPRPAAEANPVPALAPELHAGLRFGWRLVTWLLIGAAYLWPLLLGLIAWGILRKLATRSATTEPSTPEGFSQL
ncbi:DUF4349 domain-containing protein [Hymenobacter weizhouensis]|uniref:DUF4349 domain-containing protein n=1 Tax=Hymenobacter sp. YIM 151500-1 TaxID=2987689 RepID=UPI002225F3C0|nr:DUF4349 domain-containing protein [Hymenobacter sp. YIM 151500-1]UYZ64435.1 DUF4349 domain-containing protein [Hymenobacter sp. YIM 151500-1]